MIDYVSDRKHYNLFAGVGGLEISLSREHREELRRSVGITNGNHYPENRARLLPLALAAQVGWLRGIAQDGDPQQALESWNAGDGRRA